MTFTERVPELIAPAAQRTVRLNAQLRDLALAFGGQAGARQSLRSAMPASAATLLRRAHTAILPSPAPPRVLGIDEFAFQKGQVYGTILIDGETHTVVDLLPEHRAETTAAWLREHPGVEIVTRDRSSDYASGVQAGAPNAVQVADRFHLVKNAGEVLERILQRHHQGLSRAAKTLDQELATSSLPDSTEPGAAPEEQASPPLPDSTEPGAAPEEQASPPLPDSTEPGAAPEEQASPADSAPSQGHAEQRRLAQYQEVITLAEQGLGPTAIGQQVGVTRQTVARWLRVGSFPERAPSAP